jgi:hypothetical protein
MKKRTFKISNMKKLLLCLVLLSVGIQSCDDLSEMNVDPTKATPANFDPNYFLSSSEWNFVDRTSGYNGPILFQSGWVQLFASTSTLGANYYSNADKYVPSSNTNSYVGSSWDGCYRSASLANEIVRNTTDKPQYSNLNAIARIMIILNLQYVTDLYGDVPYSDAFAASTGTTLPKYDEQSALYPKLLSDLDAAVSSLDASKDIPSADLIYNGDITKWKKFGYSLLLRMAMRLTKADAATAKTYAEKAIAGGVFTSNADDAYVIPDYAHGYGNDYARDLTTPADFYEVRWSKTFVDFLSSTSDPRLGVVAEVPQAGLAANNDITLAGDNTLANQLGLPNGYDLKGGATDISTSPGYPGGTGSGDDFTPIGKYSRPAMSVYHDRTNPLFIITYAQTELLLAEAAVRGFSGAGDAATHYSNALVGAMLSLAPYGPEATISSGTATTYAAAHPLDVSTPDASLKMINEQYWATSGTQLCFTEAWNNWKRSGYPVLTPVNYTGNFSGGVIPRRQIYPTNEGTLNTANYEEAVGRLSGGDTWSAKVWWDK